MKRTGIIVLIVIVVLVFFGFQWGISTGNKMVVLDESVAASWSQVENVYQRRTDLIPNLVNTVKGYADFEKSTLTAVIEARAKATQVTVDPTKLTEASMKQFQEAQGGLSSALGRLMVVIITVRTNKKREKFQ